MYKLDFKFNKKAFTLAEVLITLAIIGVVASMTIPTLLQRYEEQATVSALKKAYSTFDSAYKLAVQENGPPVNWDLIGYTSPQGAVNVLNIMAPYLNLSKICGNAAGCFPPVEYPWLHSSTKENNDLQNNAAKARLSDGLSMNILIRSETCTYPVSNIKDICGDIGIDVNGNKPPNAFGKDYFRFWFTKTKVIPKGIPQDDYFNNSCLVGGNGDGCTGWIIFNGNMDYLECSDLSWTGKKKCN